ncbi:uncharacterized protein LOC119906929 isoform X1 [Micropterus salmoides]|uniref:uncharacterized protein LOC119906929 isoform X1 n=1 Tax=Micropterus salmoides TaxID=27706 RepID=UPI0018EC7B0D|nr:uncharacterized protein LOC119906929 isoform X1 [Micropterus salmoides]
MNLWFSTHFLVVGLFLSSSAVTPEECQPLVTPLSLADPSMMYGRMNFIMGYVDNNAYDAILKSTKSSWGKITASPFRPGDVVMSQWNKINGTCFTSTVNVTIDGDTAKVALPNITSEFHVLPSCQGCLVFSINNTDRNLNKIHQLLKIGGTFPEEEVIIRAVYLLGSESTLKDSDLERFKQQASCLGFSGEPDYHYDPKNGFCDEGESIKMTFN